MNKFDILSSLSKIIHYKAGEIICKQGDELPALYVVAHGQVSVLVTKKKHETKNALKKRNQSNTHSAALIKAAQSMHAKSDSTGTQGQSMPGNTHIGAKAESLGQMVGNPVLPPKGIQMCVLKKKKKK